MASSSRVLPLSIVVVESVAALCQFIQHTDPRFPLLYFTVLSGILAGILAAVYATTQYRSVPIDAIRITSTVGVVVSAVVFAALIAPASPTGTWFQPWDDLWVRIATVLFHGVAPVLVVADLATRRPQLPLAKWIHVAYSWPVTYLVAITLFAVAFNVAIPYPFLSPREMGWGTVSIAIASLAAMIGVIAALLYWTPVIGYRHRP